MKALPSVFPPSCSSVQGPAPTVPNEGEHVGALGAALGRLPSLRQLRLARCDGLEHAGWGELLQSAAGPLPLRRLELEELSLGGERARGEGKGAEQASFCGQGGHPMKKML